MEPCAAPLRALLAYLLVSGVEAKCVEDHSLGKCAPCHSNVQCEKGRFCCPFMKKCVASSSEACYYPIASCIPPCHKEDPHDCQCENKDYPDNWVECSGSGSGSSSKKEEEEEKEPNPISRAFKVTGDWCVGFYKHTWCWLADASGDYAKDGQPYQCSSYKGYSADEWCYRPPKPDDKEDSTGGGGGSEGGSGGEESSADGFQCPSEWYTGGQPKDMEAAGEWTMAHNVFRCMHDVQFAQWSNPVADDIEGYLQDKTYMVHSDSYDVKPPAGPAGENLFSGSPASYWKPADAASSWYSEVKQCSSFPGCGGSFSMGTGHFTAMVWAGVRSIGCTGNKHGVKGCRYKGNDESDCTTPNMGGCYDENVPKASKSLEACKAKVRECFGGKSLPGGIEAFSLEEGPLAAAPGGAARAATVGMAVAMLAGVAAVGFGIKRAGRRRALLLEDGADAAAPCLDELAGQEEESAAGL